MVSLTGVLVFTLSEGRGRFGRLRPKPVRGPPSVALSIFTLSKGRGRACPEPAEGFGRPRPKPVSGPPRNTHQGPNPVRGEPVRSPRSTVSNHIPPSPAPLA